MPLLEVRELKTHFTLRGSFLDRVRGREEAYLKAVDGVNLTLHRGEVLGVVGESGSGKTTLGRTLVGLVEASSGAVLFEGRDITHLGERKLRPVRRRLQIVFQDPHASLNPAMTIAASVGHPLTIHGIARNEDEVRAGVAAALERVGLAPAAQFMDKYPGDLSGGQKQRAALARAIILDPDVLIADEPVSMLDMSVRAKILELMGELKEQLDLTYLYITHDLATAKYFCDRIAIMYLGRIVEIGPASDIYDSPKHPYTAALLRAIPEPDPRKSVARDLPRGEVPDAVSPPRGCPFHPRCPRAFEVCGWERRDLRALLEERWTRMPEERFEEERGVLGELDSLDAPGTEARLEAAQGHHGDEVLAIVERFREERPDDPFWRGVAELRAEPDAVVVRFHEGMVPREVTAGRSQVRCHLHDPEPLARAEKVRRDGADAHPGSHPGGRRFESG